MNTFKATMAVLIAIHGVSVTLTASASSLNSLTEQNLEVLLSSSQVIGEAAQASVDSMQLADTAMQQLRQESPDLLLAAAELGDAKSRINATIERLSSFERDLLREANALPSKAALNLGGSASAGLFDTQKNIAQLRTMFAQPDGSVDYRSAHARHFAQRVEQYRNVTSYLRRQLPELSRAVFKEDALAYQQVVRQAINALTLDRDLVADYTVLLQRGENPVTIASLTLPEVGKLYSAETAVSVVEALNKRTQNGAGTDTTYRHGDNPFSKLDK